MKLLFIHPNQPSQFQFVAAAFAANPGNQVVMLSKTNLEISTPGVKVLGFAEKKSESNRTFPFVDRFNEGCLRADAVADLCQGLKNDGFVPDVIIAHAGWGDSLYVKSVFPATPLLNYMEFYYRAAGADIGFFPGKLDLSRIARSVTTDNALHALNYFNADACITPTYWQRSVHPREMHPKFSVLHEGVDVHKCRPVEHAELLLPNGRRLCPGRDEIITHVERFFENYRGFPTFIKAVELIQARRPAAQVVIVGKRGKSYGPSSDSAFKKLMQTTRLDRERTHFVGHVGYDDYLKILQSSSAHVYLSCPYVLSWSFLEALAVACPVACSNTPPVAEVGEDRVNCLMFDFFSPAQLADRVDLLLDDRAYARTLGDAARRKIVEQYDRARLLPMYVELITAMAEGETARGARAIHKWNQGWGREEPAWQRSIPLYAC